MTLGAVRDLASSCEIPPAASTPDAWRQHVARAAVVAVALGVLPFALDAAPVWRILGTIVAVLMVIRSLQLVWRAVFSTAPQHLASR
jgi:hypothetical protein